MNLHRITYDEIRAAAGALHPRLQHLPKPVQIYGVPRGGVFAAAFMPGARLVDTIAEADIVFDDIIDGGGTLERLSHRTAKPFFALFARKPEYAHRVGRVLETDRWLLFPWEDTQAAAREAAEVLIGLADGSLTDPVLFETRDRAARLWTHQLGGWREDAAAALEIRDSRAAGESLVTGFDIPLYSTCKCHLAPFFGVAHVGYVPGRGTVALSGIRRAVSILARRLQTQDGLTRQIVESFVAAGAAWACAMLECRHLCGEMSGERQPGAVTESLAAAGPDLSRHEREFRRRLTAWRARNDNGE